MHGRVRATDTFLLGLGAAAGLVAEHSLYGLSTPSRWIPDIVAGWSLIGCGVVAAARFPASRSGRLLTATGFAWFAGNFVTTGSGWLAWLSTHALFLYLGPLIHLAVTFPRGRPRGASDRVAIAGGYAISLAPGLWQRPAAAIGIALVLAAVGTFDFISSPRSRRREQLAAWCATACVALVIGIAATMHLASAAPEAKRATLLLEQLSLSALAGLLLVALLSRPWERTAIADLVVELGESRSGEVRTALAEALGDPSLQVGCWSAPTGDYVDEAGRRLAIPDAGSGREVTRIERDGHRVAVLVHEAWPAR